MDKLIEYGLVTPGDTLYITNTTPYILELERGHSQQAPRGMTEIALRECAAQIESGE